MDRSWPPEEETNGQFSNHDGGYGDGEVRSDQTSQEDGGNDAKPTPTTTTGRITYDREAFLQIYPAATNQSPEAIRGTFPEFYVDTPQYPISLEPLSATEQRLWHHHGGINDVGTRASMPQDPMSSTGAFNRTVAGIGRGVYRPNQVQAPSAPSYVAIGRGRGRRLLPLGNNTEPAFSGVASPSVGQEPQVQTDREPGQFEDASTLAPSMQSKYRPMTPSSVGSGHSASSEARRLKEIKENEQSKWFYIDPNGMQQGPFDTKTMGEWYSQGFFTFSLMIRRDYETDFIALSEFVRTHHYLPFITTNSSKPIGPLSPVATSPKSNESSPSNNSHRVQRSSTPLSAAQSFAPCNASTLEMENLAQARNVSDTASGRSSSLGSVGMPMMDEISPKTIAQPAVDGEGLDSTISILRQKLELLEKLKEKESEKKRRADEEKERQRLAILAVEEEQRRKEAEEEQERRRLEAERRRAREEEIRRRVEAEQRWAEEQEERLRKEEEEIENQRRLRAEHLRKVEEQIAAEQDRSRRFQEEARRIEEERREREKIEDERRQIEERERQARERIEREQRRAEELQQRQEAERQRIARVMAEEKRLRELSDEVETEATPMKPAPWALREHPNIPKNTTVMPQSLQDIQREEERQQRAERRQDLEFAQQQKRSTPQPTGPWNNQKRNINKYDAGAGEGLWETDEQLENRTDGASGSGSSCGGAVSALVKWCTKQIKALNSDMDPAVLIDVLNDLHVSGEVQQFILDYFGDCGPAREFCNEYLRRRGLMSAKGASPNPPNRAEDYHRQQQRTNSEGSKQRSAKTGKMIVSDKVLGFTFTPSSDRTNIGEIERP